MNRCPHSIADLQIAVFRGRQGLEQIRQDWKAITDRMVGHRHYFHLWEWHRDYLDTIAVEPDAAVFYVAYLASVPMALLPLRASTVRQDGCSLRILETPYHKHMPLSDIICDPDPEHSDIPGRMIDYLRSSSRNGWDAILLRGLLAESSSVCQWWATLPGPRIQIMRSRCDSLHYANHEKLLANVSKKFRDNLRYARNKLAKLPEARFEFVRDPALLPEAFAHFIRVEASGWKGDGGTGTAIGLDPKLRSFYEKLVGSFGATGKCQINLLMLGDECIAGQFWLRLDGTLYMLKTGYAENHAHISPGHMLLEECIRRSSSEVDPILCWNLINRVKWLDSWKPSYEAVCDLWIYNRTPRGLAKYGWASAIRILRSMYRKAKECSD
ncbi:MAG: GNAT family N-acetyltransferase [Verrucomicrobia bacterium]|nr:GNAT family N-acetyltransferase [Verrucomicrobiota bacterium]